MKSQKTREAGERTPHPVVVSQLGIAVSISKPALHAHPRSTICTLASPHGPMNCMSSGVAEKVVPWEIGWTRNRKL